MLDANYIVDVPVGRDVESISGPKALFDRKRTNSLGRELAVLFTREVIPFVQSDIDSVFNGEVKSGPFLVMVHLRDLLGICDRVSYFGSCNGSANM